MRESLPNVSNFLVYLYCKRKASEIKNSYFIYLDAQKCEEEDAEYIFLYLEYKQRRSHAVSSLNKQIATIPLKFTAEVSDTETMFLDTRVKKGFIQSEPFRLL